MVIGLKIIVQEYKGKYITLIPTSLICLLDIEKGDKHSWKHLTTNSSFIDENKTEVSM
jgi:hypothetical protein